MFFSKNLNKFKNINHCFFSKKNGFSKGIYESLNCGPGSKDSKNFVVVVDDNSPDNTISLIKIFLEKKEYKNRVHLIKRPNKLGRGSAVLYGFKWGLDHLEDVNIFIEMDCDFSHSPDDICKGVELIKKYNIVIGARYPNGKIINWPITRRIFSYFANQLIRLLINRKIYDYTR